MTSHTMQITPLYILPPSLLLTHSSMTATSSTFVSTSHGFLTLPTSTLLSLGTPSANLSGISRIPGMGAPEAIREARAAKERG
jgi:hypothetical protein